MREARRNSLKNMEAFFLIVAKSFGLTVEYGRRDIRVAKYLGAKKALVARPFIAKIDKRGRSLYGRMHQRNYR